MGAIHTKLIPSLMDSVQCEAINKQEKCAFKQSHIRSLFHILFYLLYPC